MSQSSGWDSADGTADVSTRRTITHRTVSRAQRPRKSVRGAGSSRASDMFSLPQSEAYTVQALMELALPHLAGLVGGPHQVHELWAISVASPASLTTSHRDRSGEEDQAGLSSPCLNLDGLSSSDDRLASVIIRLHCCVARMRPFPLLIQIRSSRMWTFRRSLCRAIRDRLSGCVTSRQMFYWWMLLWHVGLEILDVPLRG